MMEPLLDELAAAFPTVPLSADLFEDPAGPWDEYDEREEFVAGVEGRTWDQITPVLLESHRFALSRMPPAGFVAILPACLSALVTDEDARMSLPVYVFGQLLRDREPVFLEEFDARVALLTLDQRLVTARVLDTMLRREHYVDHLHDLENALDSYWRGLVDPNFVATPRERLPAGYHPLSDAFKQERAELLDALPRVFPAVPIHADMLGDPAGTWGEYNEAQAFTDHVSGRSWRDLDTEFVDHHYRALTYAAPAGFVAILPAYLAHFALGGEGVYSSSVFTMDWLTRKSWLTEEFDERVARFSREQCAFIARLLDTALRHRVYRPLEEELRPALDSYWRAFLDPPAPPAHE